MLEQFHIHADLKQQLSTIHEKNKQEAGENAHLIGTKYIRHLIIALSKMPLQHFFLAKNILLKGPTGSGKTVLAETLSSLFQNQCIALTVLSI